MNLTVNLLYFCTLIIVIGAPPVVENAKRARAPPSNNNKENDDALNQLEYGRYLKEVVDILESDPSFKKKLESVSADDIRSGNIAEHLSLVQHHVRTQLDEAKQREMTRLTHLIAKKLDTLSDYQRRLLARGDPNGGTIHEYLPKHLDHETANTFNEVDLERLIQHASRDLDEIDRKRAEQFKEYEMQKEYQRRAKLAKLSMEERKRLEQLHRETLEKKKRHRQVNHPGSVDQMEEVWERSDKLEGNQFSPKAFFRLHDINGDGVLDEGEIEAIMLREAAKIHEETPNADPVEEDEEMNRMRQHVMKEFDKNNDRVLSYDEFQRGINAKEAKNDQGWKSVEDNPVFSEQEYERFSEKLAPMSTPIPPHQTPSSPANNPQPPVAVEIATNSSTVATPSQPRAQQPEQIHIPRGPPVPNKQ